MSRLYSVHHIHKVFFLTFGHKPESVPHSSLPRVASYHHPIATFQTKTIVRIPAARISNFVQGASDPGKEDTYNGPPRSGSCFQLELQAQFPGAGGRIAIPSVRKRVPDSKYLDILLITQNLGQSFNLLQLPPAIARWIDHIVKSYFI